MCLKLVPECGQQLCPGRSLPAPAAVVYQQREELRGCTHLSGVPAAAGLTDMSLLLELRAAANRLTATSGRRKEFVKRVNTNKEVT